MKTIIYSIIGVVALYLIYKAYKNYAMSGNIFESSSGILKLNVKEWEWRDYDNN